MSSIIKITILQFLDVFIFARIICRKKNSRNNSSFAAATTNPTTNTNTINDNDNDKYLKLTKYYILT